MYAAGLLAQLEWPFRRGCLLQHGNAATAGPLSFSQRKMQISECGCRQHTTPEQVGEGGLVYPQLCGSDSQLDQRKLKSLVGSTSSDKGAGRCEKGRCEFSVFYNRVSAVLSVQLQHGHAESPCMHAECVRTPPCPCNALPSPLPFAITTTTTAPTLLVGQKMVAANSGSAMAVCRPARSTPSVNIDMLPGACSANSATVFAAGSSLLLSAGEASAPPIISILRSARKGAAGSCAAAFAAAAASGCVGSSRAAWAVWGAVLASRAAWMHRMDG